MLSNRISSKTLIWVLNTVITSGALDAPALRKLAVNLVSCVFEEEGASPDKKINCIKAVRSCTELGLAEAKELTEKYRESVRPRVEVAMLIRKLRDLYDNGRLWMSVDDVRGEVDESTRSQSRTGVSDLKEAVVNYLLQTDFNCLP